MSKPKKQVTWKVDHHASIPARPGPYVPDVKIIDEKHAEALKEALELGNLFIIQKDLTYQAPTKNVVPPPYPDRKSTRLNSSH